MPGVAVDLDDERLLLALIVLPGFDRSKADLLVGPEQVERGEGGDDPLLARRNP